MRWTPKGWTDFGTEYRKAPAVLLVEMLFLRVFLPKEAFVDPSLPDRAVSFCPCAAVVVASPGSPETALGGIRFSLGNASRKYEKEVKRMLKTGAEILWECLGREGVEHVFGYPGGAILPVYDALKHSKIHHVLVRHEQGATHMADGYARASGRVGVAIATSGPGATNMVTGIATAMLDSSSIVCITGQVGSKLIGSDAFQEADITGVTLPITKHNYLVTHANELARTLREAFYVARTACSRPGPGGHHERRPAVFM